jgi:hypothetical protein
MNTLDIANKLIELCKAQKNEEAVNTLFAPDAVSVEAMAMPGVTTMKSTRPASPVRGPMEIALSWVSAMT